MCELSREDQLGIMFRGLEYKRKIGKVYTLEEIELYTKENPDKVFIGDIVPSKDGDYLVYNGYEWMHLEDFNNITVNIVAHKNIYSKSDIPLNVTCPITNHNETKNTK